MPRRPFDLETYSPFAESEADSSVYRTFSKETALGSDESQFGDDGPSDESEPYISDSNAIDEFADLDSSGIWIQPTDEVEGTWAEASEDLEVEAVESKDYLVPPRATMERWESDIDGFSESSEHELSLILFPSGESLSVVAGPDRQGEEFWDPNNSGNPLLDTSALNSGKRLSANFRVSELARSGGKVFDRARIDPELVRCLQAIRDRIGRPIQVTSGFRSWGYNVALYGSKNTEPTPSEHCSGRAADIKIAGMSGMDIAKAALDAYGRDIGVGIGDTFAHIDVRGAWAKWSYAKDKPTDSRIRKEIEDYRARRLGASTSAGSDTARPTVPEPNSSAASTLSLRNNVVRLARQEWFRWGKGTVKEHDPKIRDVLKDYWKTGTKREYTDPQWWSKHPWSAAFISWVMKKAGAVSFPSSGGHSYYITAAKENRLANNTNPFKAYRITEVKPEVGDLVCRDRGSGATYDTIRPGQATHCDIVTEVRRSEVLAIGGNVRHSVRERPIPLNANGYVAAGPRGAECFTVIKLVPPS